VALRGERDGVHSRRTSIQDATHQIAGGLPIETWTATAAPRRRIERHKTLTRTVVRHNADGAGSLHDRDERRRHRNRQALIGMVAYRADGRSWRWSQTSAPVRRSWAVQQDGGINVPGMQHRIGATDRLAMNARQNAMCGRRRPKIESEPSI